MSVSLSLHRLGGRSLWLIPSLVVGVSMIAGAPRDGRADEPISASSLLEDLRCFREMGSVLHIAAHPDDENTQLITYLARGRHYRTAYLSLTRGDGGQNVIGPEFFEELGVIRTQELLAARRLDGGRQFFSRAIDFGFSKDPGETLHIWDRRQVLADIVRVIREFRPDVIITRFSPQGGGHGHHTSSAILAVEAFPLAGDPKAFPEQLKELTPWQPKRILQNGGGFGGGRGGGGGAAARSVRIEIGGNDPISGEPLGRDRRPQPIDAQVPGVRRLRRPGRRRAADRVVLAPRRRARDQGHPRRRRYHLGPRARRRRGRPTGRRDHRPVQPERPRRQRPRACWRCGLAWRPSPPTPWWTRSVAFSIASSRAVSDSRWPQWCPRPRSCRARPWRCVTSRPCGRTSRSDGCRCDIPPSAARPATRSTCKPIGPPPGSRARHCPPTCR